MVTSILNTQPSYKPLCLSMSTQAPHDHLTQLNVTFSKLYKPFLVDFHTTLLFSKHSLHHHLDLLSAPTPWFCVMVLHAGAVSLCCHQPVHFMADIICDWSLHSPSFQSTQRPLTSHNFLLSQIQMDLMSNGTSGEYNLVFWWMMQSFCFRVANFPCISDSLLFTYAHYKISCPTIYKHHVRLVKWS
jgi:hypothetical protein